MFCRLFNPPFLINGVYQSSKNGRGGMQKIVALRQQCQRRGGILTAPHKCISALFKCFSKFGSVVNMGDEKQCRIREIIKY